MVYSSSYFIFIFSTSHFHFLCWFSISDFLLFSPPPSHWLTPDRLRLRLLIYVITVKIEETSHIFWAVELSFMLTENEVKCVWEIDRLFFLIFRWFAWYDHDHWHFTITTKIEASRCHHHHHHHHNLIWSYLRKMKCCYEDTKNT